MMIDCSKCKRDSICHTPDKHMGGCHSYEEADPDVVRVVRCDQCKRQQMCRLAQRLGGDGYCSEGERKNDVSKRVDIS